MDANRSSKPFYGGSNPSYSIIERELTMNEISFYDKITDEFTSEQIKDSIEKTKIQLAELEEKRTGFKSLPSKYR